jgi:cytochrome P450
MQYFLDDFESEEPRAFRDRRAVFADAQAVMVGSTDTLTALLAHCFYCLAKNPGARDQLRKEVSTVFENLFPGEFAYKDLSSLPCLDSVISETLRMHSPVCNNNPRLTTGAILVEGSVIGEGVVVYVGILASSEVSSPCQLEVIAGWLTRSFQAPSTLYAQTN